MHISCLTKFLQEQNFELELQKIAFHLFCAHSMAFMFRRIDTRRLLLVKQVINLYGHTNLGFTHSTRGSFVQSCQAVQPSLACLSNLVSSTHFSTLCSYGKTYIPVRPLEQSPSCAHNVSLRWGHVRCLSNELVTLKMDKDVIRFSLDESSSGTNRAQTRGSDRNGAQMKDRKTYKRAKPSKRKKVNELKRYRLMAKKKMTSPNPEVRIRYKLEKAKRKEEWLIEKLRKFEVPKAPVEKYDPENLTEEEKFYLKRTGEKKKNYVPVGRRGVLGGVVLNMHLHWKKHETVKVICKPCKPGQIHQYAEELAQLSKGIVIDIKANNTIIFYRGKNYVQPKVMSPTETLSKKKALEKYTYEQSLEHTSQFIEKLEQELEEYHKHIARYKKGKEAMAEDAMAND